MLKAIETIHNGYRFRSRLEARWAVFFDSIGIQYEYEKEGYDLGDLGWYLPDFWLPDFKVYVEIKPPKEDTEIEVSKLKALRDLSGFSTLLCQGYPKKSWDYLFSYDTTDSGGGSYEGYSTFATDNSGKAVILVENDWTSRTMHNTSEFQDLGNIFTLVELARLNFELNIKNEVELLESEEFIVFKIADRETDSCRAAIRARQARFEHDEYQG